ncbi:MAG: hypothetical protein KAS32_17620 [Candidatus Peribacteraceae bacterium]|nr:hypothetical protein [Candidatus Peribacteraceae bacterium]
MAKKKKKDLTDVLEDLKAADTEKEKAEELPEPTVQLASYEHIRDSMQTGDIIAFDGDGIFSQGINLAIGKCKNDHYISHAAMVLRTTAHSEGIVQLIESTSLGNSFAGVQITRMSDHVKYYEGKIWWYPIRRDIQVRVKPMLKWLMAQEGKEYDLPQALLSALDFVPQREDFSKLFCSELCSEGLERGGVIGEVISSRINPVELIDDYFEIYEKPFFIDK